MEVAYINHSLIPPILLQWQAATAKNYSLEAIFQAENTDCYILPATHISQTLPDGLEIIAVPQRAAMKPVLVAIDEQIHFENFTRNLTIGVFSTLHQKMLTQHFPQVETCLIQYETDALQLLETKALDGVFLPLFEAQSRGLNPYIVQKCSLEVFTPQAAEGIVLVVGKKGNPHNETIKKILHHPPTQIAYEYEVAFLNQMQEHTKNEVFAYATLFMNTVMMNVGTISENDGQIIRQKAENPIGNLPTFIKNTVEYILLNK